MTAPLPAGSAASPLPASRSLNSAADRPETKTSYWSAPAGLAAEAAGASLSAAAGFAARSPPPLTVSSTL